MQPDLVHGSFAGWNQYEPLAVPSGIDAVVETDARDVQIGGYPMSAACVTPPRHLGGDTLIPKQRTAFALKAPMVSCSPPLQTHGIQSYSEERERTVTTEQRQVEFNK